MATGPSRWLGRSGDRRGLGPDHLPAAIAQPVAIGMPADEAGAVIEADAGLVPQDRDRRFAQDRDVRNRLEHAVTQAPRSDAAEIVVLGHRRAVRRDELVVVGVQRGSRIGVALGQCPQPQALDVGQEPGRRTHLIPLPQPARSTRATVLWPEPELPRRATSRVCAAPTATCVILGASVSVARDARGWLDRVFGGGGDVAAAGRGAPDQDARFRLLQAPALGLFTSVMAPAQRREVTGTGGPAVLPGLGVVQVAAGGGLPAPRRGTSGVAGADQVLGEAAGAVVVLGPGVVAGAADDRGPGESKRA